MTFKEDSTDTFKKFFSTKKDTIKSFEGCIELQLWQDSINPNTFFTYSIWANSTHLLHYRNSGFFKETWSQTKELFAAKAEAWSLQNIITTE